MIQIKSLLLLCVVATALWGSSVNANPVQRDHIEVELVSRTQAIVPGTITELGLRFLPETHWHTYWQNPGDSGIAPELAWSLPENASIGEIRWPYPERIEIGHLVNYGYEGEHVLPVRFTPPPGLVVGDTLSVSVNASWLVCRVECIPGEATLSLSLPVVASKDNQPSEFESLFESAQQRYPLLQAPAGQFSTEADQFSVRLPKTGVLTDWTPAPDRIFVTATNVVDHAKDVFISQGETWVQIAQPLSPYFSGDVDDIALVTVDDTTQTAYSWSLQKAGLITESAQNHSEAYGVVLLLALGGGLLLNLMPCVFPVLSIKALQVVSTPARQQRRHAMAYTFGVVSSFISIAGLLLALRASGQAMGWGFQLQSPIIVGGLIYVFFIMGLSLSGFVTIGGQWMGWGQSLTENQGMRGSFATGVLATIVASPCTAPFMGVALGAAVLMPWFLGLGVFVMLGFGLALPMLLLGWLPQLGRWLPTPGPWMTTFKELMAFPIYLSTVWLVWVLARQTNAAAVAYILTGLVVLVFLCWLHKQPQRYQSLSGYRHSIVAFGLIAALAMLASAARTPPTAQDQATFWLAYSPQTLQTARDDPNQAVLVNMTADWCVTCLVNEQVALSSDEFKEALEANNVVYIKGDWTRRDPMITDYLATFDRNGVPLYVFYPKEGGPPRVLPQILTPSLVIDAISNSQ